MLNHAYTLLMNADAPAGVPRPDLGPGAPWPAPGFQAVPLPPELRQLRALLFGAAPDLPMRDYRCRQLLAVTHATPFAPYLYRLDPRVTYDWGGWQLLDPRAFTPAVAAVAAGPADRLDVVGTPEPPDATGRCYNLFDVTVVSGRATVTRLSQPTQAAVSTLPADLLPLPGSGYSARLAGAADQRWRVEVTNRPALGPADLAAGVGAAALAALFFGGSQVEPYRSFRLAWQRSRELPQRVAALVCALVYRTEERRLS